MSYRIVTGEGVDCGAPYEECADAAQDAECLHAQFGHVMRVLDAETREVVYETQGAPE